MRPETQWTIKVYMPFWTKEWKGTKVWDFKGKVSNSQVKEKEQTW